MSTSPYSVSASAMAAWHPILAAEETAPGAWEMRDQAGPYAVLRLLSIEGESVYRAVTWAESSDDRRLLGYYRSLRAAAMAAHRWYVDSRAPGGGVNGLL